MKRREKNTWLFSFTDLSFLLLITLSMIPDNAGDYSLRLAKMSLPAVPESAALHPLDEPPEPWELRILPVSAESPAPFRLVRSGEQDPLVCNENSLLAALEDLRTRGIQPVLLPDKASLSHDFLFAAGALARVWSLPENQIIVKPKPAGERP